MESIVSASSAIAAAIFTPWGMATAGTKFFVYAASLLAVGLMLIRIALPQAGDEVLSSLKWLAFGAVLVAALATVMRVLVQAGRLMDDGVAGMLDPEIIAISLEGPLGQSTYVRLSGLALVMLAVFSRPLRLPATLFGSIMVAGSFALTGHATRDPQWLLAGLITFHLLAISFWWGALAPLHKLSADKLDAQHAAEMAERFGKQATLIVPMLILAGAAFAWLIMGSVTAFFTTNYGRVLLLKLVLVTVVLAFAALNKLRFVPALAADVPEAKSRFRLSLKLESLAFLLVFTVTAALTTSFTVPT